MTKSKQQQKVGKASTSDAASKSSLQVIFWGVRGTLPTPGKTTLVYGGNTSCVEVRAADDADGLEASIVLDAGSGIAAYGDEALRRGQREFHVFLSHLHYDHVIGLTRFSPLFRQDCTITFYARPPHGGDLDNVMRSLFAHPFFPVEFDSLGSRARIVLKNISHLEPISLPLANITLQPLNHPQGAVSFRVWDKKNRASVVYATDHEHGTERDEELVRFAKGASLFLYDSTYSEKCYSQFSGWGHSTPTKGASMAKAAGVRAYGLFHHDPSVSDADLEKDHLLEARKVFSRSFLCQEMRRIELDRLYGNEVAVEKLLEPMPVAKSKN